jgi:hypothetical protein
MIARCVGPTGRALALAVLLAGVAPARAADDKVQVCVLAILATEKNNTVDPRLRCIADEVRKTNPRLTGFKIENLCCQSVAVGGQEDFKLVGNAVATVALRPGTAKDKRLRVTVTPPQMGQITYTTACDKFLPIMTPFRTKDNERLLIAVRVRPCELK